jgi:hypothetical protein
MFSYNAATNNWSVLAASPLSSRYRPLAVYDGNDKVLVWGGDNGAFYNPTYYTDGAVYTISTNSWAMMPTANAPTTGMTSVSWTGTEMLLTYDEPTKNTYAAYRFNPSNNTWVAIPAPPLYKGQSSIPLSNHVSGGNNLIQVMRLENSNTAIILWTYDLPSNVWTPQFGNTFNAHVKSAIIQAANTIVINNQYGNLFSRFSTTGSQPLYDDTGVPNIYYYKSKQPPQ